MDLIAKGEEGRRKKKKKKKKKRKEEGKKEGKKGTLNTFLISLDLR